MPSVSDVSLPKTSQTGTNEWVDVQDNDDRLLEIANADRDSRLAEAAGASIDGGNVRRGVTSIATEETTTSTSYTTLTTPDQVSSVVLPSNGLIFVAYRALWKLTGASNAGSAAIFLGSNQLKISATNGVPSATSVSLLATGDNYGFMSTGPQFGEGLGASVSITSDSSYVTTGQTLASGSDTQSGSGVTVIEAAAGTYTVSIQWKCNAASGGTLSVKERKLWVWTESF